MSYSETERCLVSKFTCEPDEPEGEENGLWKEWSGKD